MSRDLDEVPFDSVEEAWFWTMGALRARRDGESRSGDGLQRRPCDPDDVLLCVERLYRAERLGLSHARVLREWGECGGTPPADMATVHQRLWKEAMSSLDQALRQKGIVGRKKSPIIPLTKQTGSDKVSAIEEPGHEVRSDEPDFQR